MKKFLSQNAHYENKSFPELVTKYLIKFEKEIDIYFPSPGKDRFAYITNRFTANPQMLQTGAGTQEELVKLYCKSFIIIKFITIIKYYKTWLSKKYPLMHIYRTCLIVILQILSFK